ncbi:MAG TPA: ABC transporter permease subunit [Candidatus Limnocylindria bacterium]|jgi:ABC-2 type transport system permease protein
MTLLRIAFRQQRTGLIVMSFFSVVAGALNAAAFEQLAGTTPAERAVFGQQMALLGKQLTYLLPDPVQLDTMGGYLTWRAFGFLALIFSIWGILAATGAGRGEEERGLVESWLAAGVSRLRWLATRTAGFVLVAIVVLVITLGATMLVCAVVNDPLPLDRVALEGVLFLGLTLVAFGLGLGIAQLVLTRRAAGSLGTIAVVVLYLLNSASRSGLELGGLANISPFAIFDRAKPLLPQGGGFDPGAAITLYLVAIVLMGLSVLAFVRRDIGGAIVRLGRERTRVTFRPSSSTLLRLPVVAMVEQQRGWLIGWTIALAALAYFLTSLGRSIVDGMMAIPSLQVYFGRLGINAYADFIGVLWFGTFLFIVSGLAIATVNGWAADDGEGRLEQILAEGASRGRVVVERIAALMVIAAIVSAVSSTVVFFGARALDLAVPGDRMAIATLDVLPVVLAFAGIGALLVGWRPRIAVVLLGTVAVLSYFVQQFYAIFDWPDWVGRLSIYQLYGTPLSKDDWGGIAALVAIGLAGTAFAVAAMRRRDVGT